MGVVILDWYSDWYWPMACLTSLVLVEILDNATLTPACATALTLVK